jgi:hypothetical protein
MKKPSKKIWLLIIVLYYLAANTDLKEGFIEGFLQKNEQQIKANSNDITTDDFRSLSFPVIIKIY